MGEPFRVRPAAEADWQTLVVMERSVFTDPWPPSALQPVPGKSAWVAEIGERVVGYLFGVVAADEAEILNLAVLPEHRRRGIARALVDTAFDHFRAAGARRVFLEVRAANQGAAVFYGSVGFRPVGKRSRYYRRPVDDAVIMSAELALSGGAK